MKQKNIQNFLNKQMTRKEFVQHIGVLFLGIIGFYNLTSHIMRLSTEPQPIAQQVERKGFGSSKFGV